MAVMLDLSRIMGTKPRVLCNPLHRDDLLYEGVEAYKKEGPKFMQRLVAKHKARVEDA
jgi:hypothetical protein